MTDVGSGEPFVVGDVTITPLERVERYRESNKKGFFFYYSKRPAGITVNSPQGSWDFDLEDWNSKAEPGMDRVGMQGPQPCSDRSARTLLAQQRRNSEWLRMMLAQIAGWSM